MKYGEVFIKNYLFVVKDGHKYINGYMGDLYPYAKGLVGADFKFTDFYTKLREAIHSVENANQNFTINYLSPESGLSRINNFQKQASSIKGKVSENIYFNHVMRVPMSEKQGEKAKGILDPLQIKFCEKNRITPVFVKDINRQKRFIIE
ncbi:hypothetical protein [Sporolactobacillus pectinivorans]|uniref:hypothetical protein n=1 Tax=Sporolactobacillus pectinivorans TaxID=1591408 RepID=UPI0012FE1BE8|nr:hypothetical protein [Sporolactobacillus pectinivorans]